MKGKIKMNAVLEFGNYRIEHNLKTGRFDVYKKGAVGLIISCLTPKACKQVVDALNKNEGNSEEVIEKAILDEVRRLNGIKEPRPANRNSFLESPLAKATREILKREK